MERKALAAGETLAIPANGNLYTNIALLTGEVYFRVGNNTWNAATDLKLTEDLRTYPVFVANSQATVHIKAIAASEVQYYRD